MSGVIVDVSDLVGRPGATRNIRRSVVVPGLRTALGWVDDDQPVQLDLTIDSVTEGFAVTGRVAGTMHLNCSRCLVGYDRVFDEAVDETYYYGSGQGQEDDDDYAVEGNQINLEPMVRDVIVLSIPAVPLHDEACRGLCATCGADLSVVDCGHAQKPTDLRWAPLEGALAQLRPEVHRRTES